MKDLHHHLQWAVDDTTRSAYEYAMWSSEIRIRPPQSSSIKYVVREERCCTPPSQPTLLTAVAEPAVHGHDA